MGYRLEIFCFFTLTHVRVFVLRNASLSPITPSFSYTKAPLAKKSGLQFGKYPSFCDVGQNPTIAPRSGEWLDRAILCHYVPFYAIKSRFFGIKCHSMPFYAIKCNFIPCNAILCHCLPFYAILCHFMPFYAILCQ